MHREFHWQWLNIGWPLCTSVLDPGNMLFGVDPTFSPSWKFWNHMQSCMTYHAQLLCHQGGPHGNLQCVINLLFVWRSFLLHTDMTFHFNLSLSSPPFSSWSVLDQMVKSHLWKQYMHVSSSFVYLHCFLNCHGNIEEKLHQLRVLSAAANCLFMMH